MGSTFLGLNIAKSGLFANQQALSVTSHNVANANTEGYSRQRVSMYAYRPDKLPGKGFLGVGVDTDSVEQIRDEYLDFKYRGENGILNEWSSRHEVLKNIETILNEPSESGIREIMDSFFASLHELNKNAESITTRTLVRQKAISLTKGINGMSSSLSKLQKDLNFDLEVAVNDLNGYANQIAKLNKVIFESELEGGKANDLRDQRNLIVDKMSQYADIDYYEDENNRFHVLLNGTAIVSNFRADQLVTKKRTLKLNPSDNVNLVDIEWESGASYTAHSGKIKGIIDLRDNISGENKGIPYYMERLNTFADTLSAEMNRVHSSGYDLNGDTGVNFFTINNMSTEQFNDYLRTQGLENGPGADVTAEVLAGVSEDNTFEENSDIINQNINDIMENNPQYDNHNIRKVGDQYLIVDKIEADELTISADIDDVNKIAASKSQDEAPGNGDNILRMANIRHNTSLYDWGSPDDFVKSLVSNLGVDTQEAKRMQKSQTNLMTQVIQLRESISGVSLDEEMSNMIKFQHGYSASARMMTTIDEMLDVLINQVGR